MAFTDLPDLPEGADITPGLWTVLIGDNFAVAPSGLAQAKGDIFPGEGLHQAVCLPAGIDGQLVQSDSSVPGGMKNSWAFVPIGGIIMWAGLVSALPPNYKLCDGANGTPNLRNQFIIGAGGSYPVGNAGGAATINVQHNHTLTTGTAPEVAHAHTQPNTGAPTTGHTHGMATGGPSATQTSDTGGGGIVSGTHDHWVYTTAEQAHTHANPATGSSGDHTHTVTSDTQLSAAQDIRPPYYALAFIMRLS